LVLRLGGLLLLLLGTDHFFLQLWHETIECTIQQSFGAIVDLRIGLVDNAEHSAYLLDDHID